MTDHQPRNPDFAEAVRASFARQAMMATLGATLDEITPGAVTIFSTIPKGATQQQGFAHAGLAFSIGDSAAGYSALSLLPHGQEVLTSEMKIHLLAPANGTRLIARGRVLRPGRRLIVTEAEVFADTGTSLNLIAKLMGTMVPVSSPDP